MGVGDVRCLTNVLTDAVTQGRDLGDLDTLRAYNRQRMVQNLGMLGTVDSIWHVFRSDVYPLQQLRSLGMNLLNAVPPLKVCSSMELVSLIC